MNARYQEITSADLLQETPAGPPSQSEIRNHRPRYLGLGLFDSAAASSASPGQKRANNTAFEKQRYISRCCRFGPHTGSSRSSPLARGSVCCLLCSSVGKWLATHTIPLWIQVKILHTFRMLAPSDSNRSSSLAAPSQPSF